MFTDWLRSWNVTFSAGSDDLNGNDGLSIEQDPDDSEKMVIKVIGRDDPWASHCTYSAAADEILAQHGSHTYKITRDVAATAVLTCELVAGESASGDFLETTVTWRAEEGSQEAALLWTPAPESRPLFVPRSRRSWKEGSRRPERRGALRPSLWVQP